QRLAVRSCLGSFSTVETHEYIRAQTAAAGGDPDSIWTADALSAVQQASGGIPRLINQICDRAMTLAAASGIGSIDGQGVENAWADLQQLPAAGNARRSAAHHGHAVLPDGESSEGESVVEFG